MNRNGILVVGSANMDLVVSVKDFPRPGETLMGKNFKMFPGGKGANQAVASAKLKCSTRFIGKLGNDDFGARLAKNMEEAGVDLDSLLSANSENTGTALITVDDQGENEIVVVSGSNMKIKKEDIRQHEDVFKKVKVVISQLEIPIEAVEETARLAKKNDCIFILNPAPAGSIPDSLLSRVDYLTPNEIELAELSNSVCQNNKEVENASKKLLAKGVKNIIVTMGGNGALLVNDNATIHFPVNAVKALDTTGAGDAFNGALATALSLGRDIGDAVRFAHNVAAISVTRHGAQSSMPQLDEVEN